MPSSCVSILIARLPGVTIPSIREKISTLPRNDAYDAIPTDPPRENYARVRWWQKPTWKAALDKGTIKNIQAYPGIKGVYSAKWQFLEMDDGTQMPYTRVEMVRESAKAMVLELENKAPSWGTVILKDRLRLLTQICQIFPELRLCEGRWKANDVFLQIYPGTKQRHPADHWGDDAECAQTVEDADESKSSAPQGKRANDTDNSAAPPAKRKKLPNPM